jgi:NAD(P)H dehydrogenase (quinone)
MKKSLIILANPNIESFCHSIANIYKETKSKINDCEVEIIDLYKEPSLAYLGTNESESENNKKLIKNYQDKISKADEIVFVHPIWWSVTPAILKNFLDNILTAGFAYKYNEKGIPQGLLTGKIAKVFTTSGTPMLFFNLGHKFINPTLKFWKSALGFCGMKIISYNQFGGIRPKHIDQLKADKYMQTVADSVNK